MPSSPGFQDGRRIEVEMEFLLAVLGVVLVIEGIPWFLSPPKVKKLVRQVVVLPDTVLRLLGFAAMIGGLLLVWVARG